MDRDYSKNKRGLGAALNQILDDTELRPYENLAMGIVAQAVTDSRKILQGKKVYAQHGGQIIDQGELIHFFESRWCDVLLGTTDLTGHDIRRTVGI